MPKLKEACGIVGVMLKVPGNEAAYLSYLSLNALQHRGQESAGIAAFDKYNYCSLARDMGLVSQVFDDNNLSNLEGHLSLGHVRYSTTGESEICNAQPITISSQEFGTLALAHNGNLVNINDLRKNLQKQGKQMVSSSDSEVLLHLLKEKLIFGDEEEILNSIKQSQVQGAFSLSIALGGRYLIGLRDPFGLRPLVLGALPQDKGLILASETCGLDIVGAEFIREIAPGEIILINENLQIKSLFFDEIKPKFCLFELIYFARPDSIVQNIQINAYREELGRQLALTTSIPPNIDLVIGIPDSGTPAAIGFAQESGIPFANGLIKNRYIGRTFIQPTQSMRQLGIRLKLNPLPSVIKGKSIIVIDDSIVRGNTPRKLVKLLKEAGAKEVHLRISSPPILWGCFYGIAMKDEELIARRLNGQVELIRAETDADSLAYLELETVLKATRQNSHNFCTACFNGHYPAGISDEEIEFSLT
jgi:amidophosphoribosyltransferase